MAFTYVVLLSTALLIYWLWDSKTLTIKLSSIYIYLLFFTVIFTIPTKFEHFIYIVSWFYSYLIGIIIVKNKRLPKIKTNLGLVIILSLCLIFFIVGIQKLLSFNFNLSYLFSLHAQRSEIELSYLEYMFNRSLFLIPFVFLMFSTRILFWRILVLVIAVLISLSSLQKLPIVLAFFSIILYQILKKKIKINLFQVLFTTIIFISIATSISLIMYQSTFDATINAVLERIFFKPGYLGIEALNLIDEGDKYYYGGASFKSLISSFGMDTIRLGKENYYYVYGSYLGSANTPSYTGAYADFGFFGILYSFIIGIVLRLFDNTILYEFKMGNVTIFIISSYICSLLLSLKLNVTVLGSTLLGEGLLTAMLITYLAICVNKNLTIKKYKLSK